MWRVLGGDHRNSVPLLGGEATEHVQHLRRLAHRLPDVAQSVGETFETAGVRRDVHVTLDQAAELGLKVDGSMKLVVAELVVDRVPDGVRRRLGNTHDRANVLGHGVVKPAQDALVDHDPVRITAVGAGGRRSEVKAETELADEGIEEASPLGVV